MINRNERGFSLIEILVAMAVAGIAAAAIFSVFESSSRSATMQNAAAGVQQSVRAALEMMVQDIRMAGYDPQGTASTGVVILQSNKIYVTSDRNRNGRLEQWDGDDHLIIPTKCELFECITYEFANNELRQILNENFSNESHEPVINNVIFLAFTGGSNWIDIELTVEEDAGWGRTVERTLETRVSLRNM